MTPFTPPGCDLRTLPYMPVYLDRLLASDFFSQANDAEFRAGFILWAKAFREQPAGSLPEDIRSLTRLAELGQDVTKMKRVRVGAMRGWILCSDGRLYHRVVAEIVLDAWIERLKARLRSLQGNAKRWGGNLTSDELTDKLVEACRYLFVIKPDADPSGIPKAILERSRKDIPQGLQQGVPRGHPARTPSWDPKLEAIPTGYPSQDKISRGASPSQVRARETGGDWDRTDDDGVLVQ